MKAVYTYCVLALLFLASCGKNIDYAGLFYTINESPDERFAQSMSYNAEHGYDKITGVPDDYEVYVMSDIHVDFSTDNLDRFVSDYLADSVAAPFALCLGDLINATDHWDYFDEHVKPVSDAGRKIYYTVGNHDLYFDQWDEYFKRFGSSTYWFEVQTVSGFKDLYISIGISSFSPIPISLKKTLRKAIQAISTSRKPTICLICLTDTTFRWCFRDIRFRAT